MFKFIVVAIIHIDSEHYIMVFDLCCLDLLKSFSSPVITQELEEHSLHALEISLLVMLDASSHYLFLMYLKSDLGFPNVKFLLSIVGV